MASPWTVGAFTLAWLGASAALAATPVGTVGLWGLGIAGVVYLRWRAGTGAGSAHPPPPAPPPGPGAPPPPTRAEPPARTGAQPAPAPRPVTEPANPPPPTAPRDSDIRCLTASEVAAALRLTVPTVVAAIRAGRLPGNQLDGEWRCNESSVRRWLDGTWPG